jgi:hypothetical protein
MKKRKVAETHRSTQGPGPVVTVSAERDADTAQLVWLVIKGADLHERVFLKHEAALALWTALGPFIRDARTEMAVRDAVAEVEEEYSARLAARR